ncbi:hypothetical protein DPMN_187886 [Dreissena polymorpha]|uniref:Uncharacterized protein n=1 Tax=Dreissena polymorpha TaxID=45954 RepID=A0A9D4I7Y5_DREPO|nr:hypothetical protein DPMN_187886 [Dreissena polymorpha]
MSVLTLDVFNINSARNAFDSDSYRYSLNIKSLQFKQISFWPLALASMKPVIIMRWNKNDKANIRES